MTSMGGGPIDRSTRGCHVSYTTARTMFSTANGLLGAQRGLRRFPVTSALVGAGLTGATFITLHLTGLDATSAVPYPLVAALYLLCVIVTTFGNAALVSQADIVLRGGYPSTAAGRRAANSQFFAVLTWSFAVAIVLPVLRLVERNAGEPGVPRPNRATPWSDVAYLVLPMIVLERRGPVDAVRAARDCLGRVWGPGVAGTTRLGTLGYVLVLVGGLLSMVLGTAIGALVDAMIGGVTMATIGCWLGLSAFITALAFYSAANAVYQAALYRFAVDGRTPPAFAGMDLAQSFQGGQYPVGHYDGYLH